VFETAELGRTIPKETYKKSEVVLRQELLELQVRLRRQGESQVILVFAGVDGAGKGETVNLINEWMDPRWLSTRAFDEPADVERERPEFWRYWLALPPRGRIGMYMCMEPSTTQCSSGASSASLPSRTSSPTTAPSSSSSGCT
jgi:polyphosphate kinase 2 (PPK2 family)